MKRPVISAVPTEPKIIQQEPVVAAAQAKKTENSVPETVATAKLTPVKSTKTEQSRQTVVDNTRRLCYDSVLVLFLGNLLRT